MKSTTKGDRLHHTEFEIRVSEYLNNKFNQRFFEKSLEIGSSKFHKFDLVSGDGSIVGECKSYSWTESGNYPSAKISTAIETLFYFSRIKADKKILIFQDDINSKGDSLAEVFVRRNEGILDDVEVWVYNVKDNIDNDEVRVVRKHNN